jgi:hypothetical protein
MRAAEGVPQHSQNTTHLPVRNRFGDFGQGPLADAVPSSRDRKGNTAYFSRTEDSALIVGRLTPGGALWATHRR